MSTLTQQQKDRYWNDGVLTVKDAVTPELLFTLRAQFDQWVKESCNQKSSYGDINSKLPGAATRVKWHQDFCYTPHSNTDLVTGLLMLDDVTEDNGPPEIAPGSHKGPLYSLWHEDVFTGAVSGAEAERMQASAIKCVGEAGSVCLMHTCVAHGSAPNLSVRPRTLFIAVYAAADAVPCCPNPVPVPGKHQGLLVRGEDPRMIRASQFVVRPPEFPKGASFFVQQAGPDKGPTT